MSHSFIKKIYHLVLYLSTLGFASGLLTFIRLHWFRAGRVPVRGIDNPIYVRPGTSDVKVFEQIFVARQYDFDLKLVPKSIIDCGANIGLASIFFHQKYPQAKIIAVEPERSNFQTLQKNCEPYPSIQCLQNAIWFEPGQLTIENSSAESWEFRTSAKISAAKDVVEAVTIDQIMAKYGMSSIDILKIDIEGAELELFGSNYDAWLSVTKVLVIEVHDWFRPGSSKPLIKALAKYDFSMFSFGEGFVCYKL